MVIPPPIKPGRITNYLKPYVLRMHFSNKYVSAQVIHTPTASVASSASSQENALRPTMENTRDVAAAAKIGKILGERLMLKDIPAVTVFYKKDQRYHGKVFMGIFAGYASARLYKMFKGTEWKRITIQTAFMFPGIVFAIFFVLNALIWGEKSSGVVPFGTMFALVFLWFGISVPLVLVGSYVGFRKPTMEHPVKTNTIPRQIPEQAWYMHPVFSVLIGGILPFGAVFIELFFILTSIWLQQFYYIFGFLFLVFIILVVTCAEISIVLCYFQLCSEDYLWWWRSYLTSGSSALYAAFYFFTKLNITKPVSGILYFGYMLIASYSFFVLTGTIGFFACLLFTRLVYSSVKID